MRLYHLESLLQCSKWSMHPAECGCVDIPRAVVEQLSVLHQHFYSNLHKFNGFFLFPHFIYLFIYFNSLSGFNKISVVILLKGQAVTKYATSSCLD